MVKNDIIVIDNAVVSYREDIALRGVSLRVRSGEFMGIVGPNGAGKTTLLTVVNGLGHLVRGRVEVLGHPLRPGNGHGLRKRVGYVPQVQNIDPRMPLSVREVAMIGRYGRLGIWRRPDRHDWKIVDEALEMVGMGHLTRRPIGHLSAGEQQRVAIARALAQEPALFLLDEPTASLDWRAKGEIMDLVKTIHDARNLTTLFVTHDLSCLPLTCDRVVLMKDGLIWGEGAPNDLLTDENLGSLFDLSYDVVVARRREGVRI
ncbi:MAG: metal ABC transporter ATP-binding protein [Chloroflexota bacterium]